MTGDIHSIEFYKQMAKAKADIDKSGEIDSAEEESIFESEFNSFDVNNDGKVDEQDVSIFKEQVALNPAEKEIANRKNDFDKQHPNFNPETASRKELEEYLGLINNDSYNKIKTSLTFQSDVATTMQYFLDREDYGAFDTYINSANQEFGVETDESEDTPARRIEFGGMTIPQSDTEEVTDETEESPVNPPAAEEIPTETEVQTVPESTAQPDEPVAENPPVTQAVTETPPVQQVTETPVKAETPVVQPQERTNPPAGGFRYTTPSRPAVHREKTLDDMTLNELNTEKEKRQTKLQEKQTELSAVQNNTNENVKNAKDKKDAARTEYENALRNDTGASRFAKDVEKNNKKTEKNLEDIDKNNQNITDKEQEISNQQEKFKSAQSTLSALESALASLPKLSGKEEDKEKDAKITAKKKELNKKIKDQKDTVKKEEKTLKNYKEDLEKLNKQKEKLEKEKEELKTEKAQLEEKIKACCNEHTRKMLDAFKNAESEFDRIKQSELQKATNEVKKANDAIVEVNEKINEAKQRELKSEHSLNTVATDISKVPASEISKYNIHETTLPDGTKVLACGWSRFSHCQPEWLNQQKHLLKAAEEMGLTLVYSDVERTVAESDAGRARKGSLVLPGGQSPHNYGVAVDLVLYKDGQPVGVNSPEQTQFAQRALELSNGEIVWGGNWNKAGERHHFELSEWKSQYKHPEYLVG